MRPRALLSFILSACSLSLSLVRSLPDCWSRLLLKEKLRLVSIGACDAPFERRAAADVAGVDVRQPVTRVLEGVSADFRDC